MPEEASPGQVVAQPEGPGGFATTHWSVVLSAKEGPEGSAAFTALCVLCQTYWRPLYAFLRRRGQSPHDAEDLVQGFFSAFLVADPLRHVSPDKGQFRNFILKSLQNHAANERRREGAERRGGRASLISLDAPDAEQTLGPQLSVDQPAEKVFDRVWAQTVMHNAGGRLREEYTAEGRAAVYEAIAGWLAREPEPGEYNEAAARLGFATATIPVLIHRLRKRLGELVRAEIAQTVDAPEEVEPELRHLLAAMSVHQDSTHWP